MTPLETLAREVVLDHADDHLDALVGIAHQSITTESWPDGEVPSRREIRQALAQEAMRKMVEEHVIAFSPLGPYTPCPMPYDEAAKVTLGPIRGGDIHPAPTLRYLLDDLRAFLATVGAQAASKDRGGWMFEALGEPSFETVNGDGPPYVWILPYQPRAKPDATPSNSVGEETKS